MGKFISQGSYFHTARPKMQEEREARLRVEAELCQTKQRLARVEEQLALVLQTQGGSAPSCHSANTESSSESERISRLEAQLAIFMGIQISCMWDSRELRPRYTHIKTIQLRANFRRQPVLHQK